jgi:hypothetical protein
MKRTITLPRLDRVVAVLDGSAKLENPFDVQNLRLQGYDYWMRYGYTTIQAKQTNFVENGIYGLGWAQGVSQTSAETSPTAKEEFITIENVGSPAVIRPYLRNATTLAPTQIGTNTLVSGKWNFASYNNYVYAINPGADKFVTPSPTVYKHLIGETTGTNAWVSVQDSTYSAPPSDPVLLVNSFPNYENSQRGFLVTDTVTFNGANLILAGTETYTIAANKDMQIGGTSYNGGTFFNATITVDFTATPEDWTNYGYVGISIRGIWVRDFKQFFTPQIKIAGVWTDVEFKYYFGEQDQVAGYDRLFATLRIKGVAGINAVQGFRFSINSGGTNYASGHALTVEKLYIGGNFLEAKASSSRIWFPNGSTSPSTAGGYNTGIKYGVRFTHSTGTPVPSNADIETITAQQAQGTYIYPSYFSSEFSIGGVISLSVLPTNTATYNKIQFLRQMEDGVTWKLLSEQNNTGTNLVTFVDTKEEHELTSLTTVTVTANTTPPSPPTFRTAGIVGAFPYKQSMVWLVNQTYQNLQFSRVGDPLELFDSTRSYNSQDNTIPAQYTLADDQADVPVWGTQAGVSAFIIGKNAAYAMSGDYPSGMSPSRQIPGSRGIVGYYAGTRFRASTGDWGCAYADPDLNIWVVSSVPAFVEDTSAKPQEISLPIRGKIKDYLYTQQKLAIANLDIADTKLEFQEETSSLWVMLGKRCAVFRQDMVGNGWELYDFTLASTGTINTCTTYFTDGASATEYSTGTTWTNFGLPFSSDDSYCLNTFSLGAGTNNHRTKYLDCDGYAPVPLIPANATITGVSWRLEDSKTGDLAVTNIHAHPTHNGTPIGSNLATNRVVTTSDVTQTFTMVSLPTLSQLNSGQMGIHIRYESEEWLAAWQDPANYTVVITPTSPQVRVPADPIPYVTVYTVTITYTAGGSKPPYAFVNLTGQTTIGGDVVPILGTGTTDNGLGGTNSGQIGTLAAVPPDPPVAYTVSTNTTVRQKVLMSAGVGTYQVTMTSDGTLPTNKFQATHTLTGVFDPATLATVRVDNVSMQICYDTTTTGTNVKWDRAVFSPNGKYIAIRSTGETDIIEKDFRNGQFIGGINRDSGLTPPDWFFTTQQVQWDGGKARLASVQYHGEFYADIINTAVSVDGSAYVSGTLEGVNTSRWYKFHPSVSSGIRHNIKFTGSESDASLKGFALEFSIQSRGKPK